VAVLVEEPGRLGVVVYVNFKFREVVAEPILVVVISP
jgi:hypothetical protein